MVDKYYDILKDNKLFRNIDTDELRGLIDCLEIKVSEYSKNEVIALIGERFDNMGIILEGSAAVGKEDAEGNRMIMALLCKGDMFGEMAAFSDNPAWPATVQAQDKCKVCFIPTAKVAKPCQNVCAWHTTLIRNLLAIISEKALLLNRKVEYLTIKTIRGRISALLLEHSKKTDKPMITVPMNRNELADFLNVSRPSLSRELCKMREEGIIDFHMATFKILDSEMLKASIQ